MKSTKITWSKHVDKGEFWMRHGFRIGHNFVVDVPHDEREELGTLLDSMKTARILSENAISNQMDKRMIITVADDTEAVQFKLSIR